MTSAASECVSNSSIVEHFKKTRTCASYDLLYYSLQSCGPPQATASISPTSLPDGDQEKCGQHANQEHPTPGIGATVGWIKSQSPGGKEEAEAVSRLHNAQAPLPAPTQATFLQPVPFPCSIRIPRTCR